MDHALVDRRRNARFVVDARAGLRGTLRPGCSVALIDVSSGGALVECARPLRPGASVHFVISAGARPGSVNARVLRCMVWAIDALDGVRYRGALKFDRNVSWQH